MSVKLGAAFERGPSTCGKALLEKNKKYKSLESG
jgi:hypothetical protein